MRPVDKGGVPAGFPYSESDAVVMSANRKALHTHLASLNLASVSPPLKLQECVEAWAKHVDDSTSKILDTANKATIDTIIEGTYKKAAGPLVSRLGSFCSYCETYIPGLLDVEHVCAKAQYPLFSLKWDNFLLACGPCNTKKSDAPERTSLPKPAGVTIKDREEEYRNTIRQNYIWPDTNANSYAVIKPDLFYYDSSAKSWKLVEGLGRRRSVDPGLKITNQDSALHEIHADLPGYGNALVKVTLLDDPANTHPEAIRSIDLCGLNEDSQKVYDRRVMNRTNAWFAAVHCACNWDALESSLSGLPASVVDQHFYQWLESTIQSAAKCGFFSVWMKVLKRFSRPNAPYIAKFGRIATYAHEFLLHPTFATAFPNTDPGFAP